MDFFSLGLGLWLLGKGIAMHPQGAKLLPWVWCVVGGVLVTLVGTPVL